ncbi:hypothetical protein MZD87_08480 [Pediococcus pentosaceus]|nr:hypothetical protein [Pediococcus pentosaceus]
MPFAFFANAVCPTGAICRIVLHNKHDFIKTNFALDACFQQEPFRQTISWRVLPEQGKLSELERKKNKRRMLIFKNKVHIHLLIETKSKGS